MSGEQAAETIINSPYNEVEGQVDEHDAVVQKQKLEKGQLVRVWPTDSGSNHKELGKLVSINSKEVIIETATVGAVVRIHAPRHGFRVDACSETEGQA